MPFKCALCELEIQVGEPMLADEKMNLAHEICVKRNRSVDPPSTVVVSPSSPKPPSPPDPSVEMARSVAFRMAHNIPVPIADLRTAMAEPCLMPRAPSLCSECQKPAISMCPSCHAYVHQGYGYSGDNCSGRHEGKCAGARESRNPEKKLEENLRATIDVLAKGTLKNGNGTHKKKGRR